MARIQLKDQDGDNLVIQQGESHNMDPITFKDLANPPVQLTAANIVTLTLTLFDAATEAKINSRNAQDVKNANGGTLDTDGTFTMALDPADAAIASGSLATGGKETKVARYDWTWNDGQARTGRVEFIFEVEKVASIT